MSDQQFRFAYFTPAYDQTVAFYHDGLGFSVVESWDRSADDKGSLIRASAGLIEVLALPDGEAEHLFDSRPPQGAFMVIEVEHLEELYERARAKDLGIQRSLGNQSWGHRSFCVREPNGLTLYFFNSVTAG